MPNENLLRLEASPYLRQHAENPVHWAPWGKSALAEAKARNLPILLSIGYAACHWCHVMAHESFEDQDVADIMNAHFVCIKVDREERPDIDDIYMTALSLMGEQGGWPLTMFLDSNAQPFWGGTYFPKESAHGRPGFKQLMLEISRAYQEDLPQIATNSKALVDGLRARATADSTADYPSDTPSRAMRALAGHIDRDLGGIGGAPKFPQPTLYRFLLEQSLYTYDANAEELTLYSLQKICEGGIYDHIGGGFARYTVDAEWLIPHFEKMLYDNALIISLLSTAYKRNQNPLFKNHIHETIDWLCREMRDETSGAFTSSLDADSEGEEGKFYVWHWDELGETLGSARTTFAQTYGCQENGNFEGHNIPSLLYATPDSLDREDPTIIAAKQALFKKRQGRVRPGRDDKILADWNGMTITALCDAANLFSRRDWLELAQTVFQATCNRLMVGDQIMHSACGDVLLNIGLGEDYVHMAEAAIALFSATGDWTYVTKAKALMASLFKYHDSGRGFSSAQTDQEDILVHNRPVFDGAVPSLNGPALCVLSSIAHITGDPEDHQAAVAHRRLFSGHLSRSFVQMPQFMRGAHRLDHAICVAIITPSMENTVYRSLHQAAAQAARPDIIIAPYLEENISSLSSTHPAFGKTCVGGQPTAYICGYNNCLAPVTSIESLKEILARPNLFQT